MMRIALVVPEYRTEQGLHGGVATVADFVIDAFADVREAQVEVLSPRMWSRAPESQRILSPASWFRGPQSRSVTIGDTCVTYVGSRWAEIQHLRFRGSRLLRKLLGDFDILVVICGSPASFELVRGVGKPVLGQVATTVAVERQKLIEKASPLMRLIHRTNTLLVSRLDRSGVGVPNVLLVENPWMAAWAQTHGAENVRIVLPGVDVEAFSPRTGAAGEPGYILSVGRLADPRKNLSLLIRAYAIARAEYGVRQRLVLAGRNSPPSEVWEEIRRHNLGDAVDVHSDVSGDGLSALYREADFFAMSSSEEGLGMVMMEAMASGLPVVSTATEGAKVVVGSSEAGVLVDLGPGEERGLATAISRFANDERLRTAARLEARARAETNFSSERAGERFREAILAMADFT
ncbi:glycosyltransferase family 1 protein [Microbacterium esteraromaticum]|nr:glycosyltransferase family 1 protein [Microbacterium esteraromaticum]